MSMVRIELYNVSLGDDSNIFNVTQILHSKTQDIAGWFDSVQRVQTSSHFTVTGNLFERGGGWL